LHRLWDPLSRAEIALVTYAMPIKELTVQERDHRRTTVVDFELHQWDPHLDRRRDTSFSRHFELPDTNLKRPNLIGFVVTGSTTGVSAWNLVATQPDNRRARSYDVTTPGLGTGPVALSDIVIGSTSQGVAWQFHNAEVSLAPTNAVDRMHPLTLYYQVRSDSAHEDLRTTVAIYRVDRGTPHDSAALTVSFSQPLARGINELAPELDASRLDKGSYQLEIRITDARGVVVTRRRASLDLFDVN
jgi:hypothetical protein